MGIEVKLGNVKAVQVERWLVRSDSRSVGHFYALDVRIETKEGEIEIDHYFNSLEEIRRFADAIREVAYAEYSEDVVQVRVDVQQAET